MKKRIFNKLILFLFFTFIFCDEVSLNDAENIAKNLLLEFSSFNEVEIEFIDIKETDQMLLMYIFNFSPSGYAIISGDDRLMPVIGYSISSNIDMEDLPPQLDYIIDSYSLNIIDVINNDIQPNEYIKSLWDDFSSNENLRDEQFREIFPLITANWNQGGEWNDLCPGNSVVGCVAVAMGQVMYYWEYPNEGFGYSQYYDPEYGVISVDFEEYTYNFSTMEDDYPTYDSQLLLYHAGVAVHMDYSPWGSGASVCWDGPSAQNALDVNFQYNDNITCEVKINYSDEEWELKMKDQLDRGWPMVYRGYSEDAGHAWNIDGYQNMLRSNYFHCNWGWGGSANGYFYFDNLNGGGYNFIENQAALLNIIPDNINPPVALFEFSIEDLTVGFNDLSFLINDDNLANWYWDFGDGSTSTIQFPVHIYDDYGSYTVSLVTTSEYGFDSNPHIEIIELFDLTGDINNDNTVDILDVIYLVEILLSNTSFQDSELFEIDLNNDNQINIMDIVLLVQIILN